MSSSSRFSNARCRCAGAALAAAAVLALSASPAFARNAYVTNSGDGTVSVFDAGSSAGLGTVAVGGEPVDVAITPDGTRAFVVNLGDDSVAVLDTGSNALVGAPIPVGEKPRGIAITPDGLRAYVSNSAEDTVSVIDTAARAVVGEPIPVGKEPDGIAITSDGRFAFVAQRGGDISVIDTSTNAVVDTMTDELSPSRIALGPRGGRGFISNRASSSASAFNPVNRALIGSPITVGKEPAGVAIDPSGKVAYVASPADGTLTPIDTSLDSILSPSIGGFPGATGIAFGPVGLNAYVSNEKEGFVTVLDATRNVAAGSIPVGKAPNGVAVVPDQGPHASFFISPTRKRAQKRLTFHGAGSSDSDGKIATYVWDFGDGGHAEGDKATRVHKYKKPGNYLVTLVVTDDEGCSTEIVFTGQTASCNGSAAAAYQSLITVLDATGPVLALRGGRRQRLRSRVIVLARCPREPCTFRARGFVVTKYEGIGGLHRARNRLGGASVLSATRGWRRLALRVPGRTRRAVLRALRRGGKAKARISVLATDLSGDQTLRTRTVKLTLPSR